MDFDEHLKRNIKLLQKEVNQKITDVVVELFTKVVDYTPDPSSSVGGYSKGLLVNQWYVGINQFSTESSNAINSTGTDSYNRIKELINSSHFLEKDGMVTFSNNISYAYRAEALGWPKGDLSSGWQWTGRVGAYGMVSRAFNEIKQKVK